MFILISIPKTLLLIFFSMSAINNQASTVYISEVIDKAGQQRMLSQRIAKAFILKGIDNNVEKGVDQLASAKKQFRDNMLFISQHKTSKPLSLLLNQVKKEWLLLDSLTSKPNSRSQEIEVIQQSDALLIKAHEYVLRLQSTTGKKISEVVGISGRQRMLSQRIARNYLAYYRKLEDKNWLNLVYDDLTEYESTLSYLKDSSINTPIINRLLQKAHSNFRFINLGIDGILSFSEERLIHISISSTEIMLIRMNELTKKYASLEKSSNTR